MKVEVSSDKPLSDSVVAEVANSVEAGLVRHKDRLTRAEVHLKNVDGAGPTKPMECTLEARPKGRNPVVASHSAASMEESVAAATQKMDRLLESLFGQLDSPRGGASASGQPT